MKASAMGGRAAQTLDPFSWAELAIGGEIGQESGAWPTQGELDPGFDTIAPQPCAASDFWCADNFELTLGREGSDRNDTIPSPPPDLESAPQHGEY